MVLISLHGEFKKPEAEFSSWLDCGCLVLRVVGLAGSLRVLALENISWRGHAK